MVTTNIPTPQPAHHTPPEPKKYIFGKRTQPKSYKTKRITPTRRRVSPGFPTLSNPFRRVFTPSFLHPNPASPVQFGPPPVLFCASKNDKISQIAMRALILAACAVTAASGIAHAADAPSFTRDVRPLLQRQCQGCHQPSSKAGNLDLTTFEGFTKGGNRGPAAPLLVKYLKGESQPRMPLGGAALPNDQIDLIAAWLAAGAKDDTAKSAADTISAAHPPVYTQAPVISALAFSPDGQTLAVSGYREILLHKADGSSLTGRLVGLSERLNSIVFSTDGKLLVTAGGTPARFGELQVWDTTTSKLLRSITLTNDTLFGGAISPDAKTLSAGGADNTVRLVETATGKELQKIGNHENWVLATVFGVDSKRLVSVSKDRAAKLIDSASGGFLENVNLLRGELTAIARHPNKDIVVIGGEERVPYIYLMDRPKVLKTADDTTLVRKLPRQDGLITALAWSPNGKHIAVAGIAPLVNIYDADTGQPVASCKGHTAGIYALSFTPDSTRLASGGFDGHVRICNPATGEVVKDFVAVPLIQEKMPQVTK